MISLWLLFALAPPHACALLEREPITAGDLVALAPAFSQLPADVPVAPAPPPGTRRVFRSSELAALARSHSLAMASAEDVCFEWTMNTLDKELLLAAMRSVLPSPDAHIQILETSPERVPPGRLEFHRNDLPFPAAKGIRAPVVWRGDVLYGANRRFAIWARVLISYPAPDIVRGDLVDVEVRSGGARLWLRARSESEGRTGETISLRNLASNKVFPALVQGKGKALVDTGAAPGN
jgi:hypothetical protein